MKSVEERFWEKVDKRGPDECWEWIGSKDKKGYGKLNVEKKPTLAHRLSVLLDNRSIPEGLVVCHDCDNPSCVNPKHLIIKTQKFNIQDSYDKGRRKQIGRTLCNLTKLTWAIVRQIRSDKGSQRQLARKYGVSQGTICFILNGQTWKEA